MITKLTPEQEAMIPELREKYRSMGLTAPDDMSQAKAKAIITRLYQTAGLDAPKKVVLCDSPAQCLDKIGDKFQSTYLYGGADMYWLSTYLAAREFGVVFDCNDRLDAYVDYAVNLGHAYAYDDICYVSRKPDVLKFDVDQLLHAEHGPAIKFRDGYSVYAWHGTRIPAEWIEDRDNLDPSIGLTWENMEQRRAAAEIIGWEKVLNNLEGMRVIDEEDDPEHGRLVEVDLPDNGPQRFLIVMCATGRQFALCVDNSANTVKDAHADIAGAPRDKYQYPIITA